MIDAEVHEEWSSKANGTSYLADLEITYQELVDLFGEPTIETDGYKVDAEWHISFREPGSNWTGPEDAFVTIYNYKNGKNYCGADGLNLADITSWHVGGKAISHTHVLEEYIGQAQAPKQLKFKLEVGGTGCWTSWSGEVTGTLKFKVTEPSVGPSGEVNYRGFAEGRFYLDNWNNEFGMVYTDREFIDHLNDSLEQLGFKHAKEIDYSEAGMQGENYVSLDASYELAQEAIKLGYDITIPEEHKNDKTKGEKWMDTGDFCAGAGEELAKAGMICKLADKPERSRKEILNECIQLLEELAETL